MSDLRIHGDSYSGLKGYLSGQVGNVTYSERHVIEIGKKTVFSIVVPRRLGANQVLLKLISADNGEETNLETVWKRIELANDIWEIDLTNRIQAGIWFLGFVAQTVFGELWFSREFGNLFSFVSSKPKEESLFQLTVTDVLKKDSISTNVSPGKSPTGGIYHIFVDRFSRAGDAPFPDNGEKVENWDSNDVELPAYPGAPMKNNRFWGGNILGIIQKLDYIKSLGISYIYMSPIFLSPSNHRYDTSNYRMIDPLVGTEEDLKNLIQEGKQRGIGIILDGVFNHTGADSLYFNKFGHFKEKGAYQSTESSYYPWYNFREFPNDYECWWNIPILPRINPDNPDCRSYFTGENGIVPYYSSLGIAGWRLDVADELSDSFIEEIAKTAKSKSSGAMVWGEVWEDASNKIAYGKRKHYYLGKELDGVMNYPLRDAIISFLRDGQTGLIEKYFDSVLPNMPKNVSEHQMNLIGTHDTIRAITALSGQLPNGRNAPELAKVQLSSEERSIGEKRLVLAYLMTATLPGMPMIYYGDELGFEGYSDPLNRMPFPKNVPEDNSVLKEYRKIGKLRSEQNAFQIGIACLEFIDEQMLIYSRKTKKQKVFVAINRSNASSLVPENLIKPMIKRGRSKTSPIIVSPLSYVVF